MHLDGGGAHVVLDACALDADMEVAAGRALINAEYVAAYRLRLVFTDGKSGKIDLEPELWGEVFEPLRDPETFKAFRIDRELSTIVWSTGADLAPEFLHEACKAEASERSDLASGAE